MKNDLALLQDLSWGYRAARVLHVANSLDMFTVLSEKPMSVEGICQRCCTKPEMTEKLLIACVAIGLLQKQGEQYKNAELAETYLVRGRPLYQGDIIAHSNSVWDFWTGLEDQVRAEGGQKSKQADGHRSFIMGMHNITVAGRGQMFLDAVDLSGRKRLFDVGGGPGTYSIIACKRYPELRAIVFDLPETIAITKEVIANEGMSDRVETREGNWETDDFGTDNDVVLLSNVLHGQPSVADVRLKKVYGSMVHGGLLVIQEFLLNDAKTGPLIPALFNVMVGAYSEAELLSIVEKVGFVEAKLVLSCESLGAGWITAKKP